MFIEGLSTNVIASSH